MTEVRPPTTADRRAHSVLGMGCVVAAVGLLAIVVTHDRLLLPVTLDLPGAAPGLPDPTPRFEISRVDLGLAALVILVLAAVTNFAARLPSARWAEYGLAAPITVFLVAQLNGITDAGALIAIYSLTSAMVLLDLAELRNERIRATSPWGLGTMVGIVPWGIIALHQVGGAIAGHPAPVIVQVITMSMLGMFAATSLVFWRERSGDSSTRVFGVMSTATTVVFAVAAGVAILTR